MSAEDPLGNKDEGIPLARTTRDACTQTIFVTDTRITAHNRRIQYGPVARIKLFDGRATASSSRVTCQYVAIGDRNLLRDVMKPVSSTALLPTFSARFLPSGTKRQRTVERSNQRFASSTIDALR
jgi:hypothetical protein